jgi:hypothetical protein
MDRLAQGVSRLLWPELNSDWLNRRIGARKDGRPEAPAAQAQLAAAMKREPRSEGLLAEFAGEPTKVNAAAILQKTSDQETLARWLKQLGLLDIGKQAPDMRGEL